MIKNTFDQFNNNLNQIKKIKIDRNEIKRKKPLLKKQ